MNRYQRAVSFSILAAVLYALNAPLSKLLLRDVPSAVMAGLLYLGAGIGLSVVALVKKVSKRSGNEEPLNNRDLPYVVAMILLDIAAPISLLLGLSRTTAANVSLLSNFEIVATALIALLIFKEAVSKLLWLAILLMTASSLILSFEGVGSLSFSAGSLLTLLACTCWGLENNCTRKLSSKNPVQIVMVKGLCSGAGSLIIGFCIGQRLPAPRYILAALTVGFFAYGLSIFFYVLAQRELGAAKTSTYYAVAPFVGIALSLIIFHEVPQLRFWIALAVMAAGTYLASTDRPPMESESAGKQESI